MQPRDACTKTGKPVLDVLREKHPKSRVPFSSRLEAYPGRPTELVHLDLIEDTVVEFVLRLSWEGRSRGHRLG